MKPATVAELLEILGDLNPAARVYAVDPWGLSESPVVGVHVREGVETVILNTDIDVDDGP